jgi:DNA repair photolyase
MEPGVALAATRLRVVRMLVDAGIATAVAMAPILPGLSESVDSMAAVVRAAREAGATRVGEGALPATAANGRSGRARARARTGAARTCRLVSRRSRRR